MDAWQSRVIPPNRVRVGRRARDHETLWDLVVFRVSPSLSFVRFPPRCVSEGQTSIPGRASGDASISYREPERAPWSKSSTPMTIRHSGAPKR